MRACVQRVRQASVTVEGQVTGQIGCGMLVLLGVAAGDTDREVAWLARKLVGLRIFADDAGKMNRSLAETGGSMLIVSQFTLLGDATKGRRPSFVAAAEPARAEELYEAFVAAVAEQGVPTATGQFAATMDVALVNDGPVTLIVETPGAGQGAQV